MWHQHFCHTSLRTYAQYFSPLFDQKSQFHLRNWSLDTWSTSEFICYAAMLSTNSYSLGFGRLEWWMFLTKVALRLGDSHRFARIDCSFPRVVAEPWLDRRRNSSLKKPTSVGIYWKLLGWTWVTRDPFQTAHEHPWYFSPFRFMKNIDFKYALPSVPLLVAGCSRMRGVLFFLEAMCCFCLPLLHSGFRKLSCNHGPKVHSWSGKFFSVFIALIGLWHGICFRSDWVSMFVFW